MQVSITRIIKALLFLQLNLLFSSAFAQSAAQPDIKADKTSGCAPEAVKFTVINAPENSVFLWVINKDTIKNGKPVQSYIFAEGGSYDVSVYLTVPSGNVINIYKPAFINLGKASNNISLAVANNFLCNGADTVTFTASAKGASAFDWIIDGSNYLNTGNKITHRFKSGGYKKVSIRVKDSSGCYGLKEFDSAVYIATPPTLGFSADITSGCLPLQVNFTSSVTKGNSEIVSYSWSFPGSDNIKSNIKNPSAIKYNKEGEFDVILKVTTKDGCEYNITKKAYIKTGVTAKPVFIANKMYICPGDTVIFTNTTAGNTGNKYSWSFSGGKMLPMPDSVTQPVIFSESGSYNATLSYNNGGCIQSNTVQKIVIAEPTKADFTADRFCGCNLPAKVNFINQSTAAGNLLAKYKWTFFDTSGNVLSTSTAKNPSLEYKSYGKYKVSLSVTSATGCTDKIVKEDFLEFWPLDTIFAKLDAHKEICPGQKLRIGGPDMPKCGSGTELKYFWTFYGKDRKTVINTATGKDVQMSWPDTGNYVFKLKLVTSDGCEAERIFANKVRVTISKPDFTASKLNGCKDGDIILNQKTTPEGMDYSHAWVITNSNDKNIVINGTGASFRPVFPAPGIYHVKYIVTVGNTCVYTKEIPNMLTISGISGDFTATQKEGCVPFTTNLNAKVLDNVHFQNTSDIVKFSWSAIPAIGVKFSNPENENTDVTIEKTGCYTIILKMTNSDGCISTISKQNLICAGVTAGFGMPASVCYGETVKIKNQSSANANTYKWTGSSGVKFSAENVSEPVITFADKGKYTISLKIVSAIGCKDSISKTINVERVKAMFTSSDTMNTCAPAYVSFSANKMDADSFFWFFGDGEKLATSDTNVAHVYKNNSGDAADGFDVMLVVKNKMGCRDTLIRSKYIKVIGPVPAFTMTNIRGCEPLKVEFTNNSKNTLKWYLDYNDFSRIDSQVFGPQVYTIKDPKAEFAVFKPRLLAKDKFGCSAWANAEDSIVVYRKPEAGFSVDNNQVCQGEPVSFTQNSQYASKYFWDFNNDGITDDTARNPKAVLKPGIYSVKLKVVNRFGCADSMVLTNAVEVQPSVNGKIEAELKTVCAGNSSKFSFAAEKPELIKNISWYINGSEIPQPEDDKNYSINYYFKTPGTFAVEAVVESNFGCVKRIPMNGSVLVPDTNRAVTPPMQVVTVSDNKNIKISWSASGSDFFKKYKLYRKENNGFVQVYETATKTDTFYTDKSGLDVNAYSYTYRLQTEDICGRISFPGASHSSVLLNVSVKDINQLFLSWSAYKGWDKVIQYNIYRSEDGVSFTKLTQVKGDVTTYEDNSVCDKEYFYYVEAVKEAGNYTSVSNIAKGKPEYKLVVKGENIVYASVINDKDVEIKWNATVKNVQLYLIDRFEPGKGWVNNYAVTNETSWIDENANVHNSRFTYRIRIKNECDYITEAGTIGRNILLKARVANDRIKLNWNSYAYWNKGIRNYQVEILTKNGNWKQVSLLPGYDTAFTDYQLHEDAVMPYTYRVTALENSINENKSVSNTVKVILPSRVFVPNVFTPNNDGRNDEFIPKTSFINEGNPGEQNTYKFMIFDRWGEKLFETDKLSEGWDGMYKGVPVPEGTYMYIINAMGYDLQSYYLKGTFHLMK